MWMSSLLRLVSVLSSASNQGKRKEVTTEASTGRQPVPEDVKRAKVGGPSTLSQLCSGMPSAGLDRFAGSCIHALTLPFLCDPKVTAMLTQTSVRLYVFTCVRCQVGQVDVKKESESEYSYSDDEDFASRSSQSNPREHWGVLIKCSLGVSHVPGIVFRAIKPIHGRKHVHVKTSSPSLKLPARSRDRGKDLETERLRKRARERELTSMSAS